MCFKRGGARVMTSYAGSTQRRDWTFTEASLEARREAALRSATQARAQSTRHASAARLGAAIAAAAGANVRWLSKH